jgi:hypothetical protein
MSVTRNNFAVPSRMIMDRQDSIPNAQEMGILPPHQEKEWADYDYKGIPASVWGATAD